MAIRFSYSLSVYTLGRDTVTNYNARRRYTPNKNKGELTSDLYREIFELRETVKNFEAERDRLRGSLAIFEAEIARLEKLYNGIYDYVRSIEGGM